MLSMFTCNIFILFQAKRLTTNDLAAIKVIKLEPGQIILVINNGLFSYAAHVTSDMHL